MKTRIEYAAWIKQADGKEIYNNLSRKEWLSTMRIIFKVDPNEIITEIRRVQAQERKSFKGYYNPATFFNYPYHIPVILAQYNIHPNQQWYYIQPYGKETTIIHSARKLVAAFGHDPDTLHDDLLLDIFDLSFLDPAWNPTLNEIEIDRILDELSDINYHSLRSFIEEKLFKKVA